MTDVATIIGTRPQFIKAGALEKCLKTPSPPFSQVVINTGQHYDELLSDEVFRGLGFAIKPDIELGIGSMPPGRQTGGMIAAIEEVLLRTRPKAVLVYGDTNSTLAGSIAAAKLDIPVIHVEAGVRLPYRRQVPEEINRILTDHAAHLNLTATELDLANLRKEGMGPERARFTGDMIYDLFLQMAPLSQRQSAYPASLNLAPGAYHAATIHRAENTDDPDRLRNIFLALSRSKKPVVTALHPRTTRLVEASPELRALGTGTALRLLPALGYMDFQALLLSADRVVTDSGGVSREAYFARRPCIIPRQSSWFPQTVEAGWTICTGDDFPLLTSSLNELAPPREHPDFFGTGNATHRICDEVARFLAGDRPAEPW